MQHFLEHLFVRGLIITKKCVFFIFILTEHVAHIIYVMLPFLDFVWALVWGLKSFQRSHSFEILRKALCRFHLVRVRGYWQRFWKVAHLCVPFGQTRLVRLYHNLRMLANRHVDTRLEIHVMVGGLSTKRNSWHAFDAHVASSRILWPHALALSIIHIDRGFFDNDRRPLNHFLLWSVYLSIQSTIHFSNSG